MNQDRFHAENIVIFENWFNLYESVRAEYGILNDDTYNIDEKGFMLKMTSNAKVVVSQCIKQAVVKQNGNREWASAIKTIDATGKCFSVFWILKGILQQEK